MSELATLTPAELHERLDASEVGLLIDLAEPEEIAEVPAIPGAVNMPFSQFRTGARPDSNYQDEGVVLYCAHGSRSEHAGRALAAEGWTVAHLAGGITAWNAAT